MVEHIIREIKIFKILSYPYRNRRKPFGLRVNLIAAILLQLFITLNYERGLI